MAEYLWIPPDEFRERANLTRLMRRFGVTGAFHHSQAGLARQWFFSVYDALSLETAARCRDSALRLTGRAGTNAHPPGEPARRHERPGRMRIIGGMIPGLRPQASGLRQFQVFRA